jgi:hypothetical protein
MENKPQTILFKYPTRERPKQFGENLRRLCEKISDKENCFIRVDMDIDDATVPECSVIAAVICDAHKIKLLIQVHPNKSKIEAINRGLFDNDFDICVLMSDDMACQVEGFDTIIRSFMSQEFQSTDGALWFHDGDKANKGRLCTMVIAGWKYLKRFGHIYHPSYKSLWADDEFTIVGNMLGKLFHSAIILFLHDHYMNNPALKPDDLMKRNQAFYLEDKRTYAHRLRNNFFIKA